MCKKLLLTVLSTLLVSNLAFAADATCEARAAEKKLAGAAKNSFMKKCEADAAQKSSTESCDAQAAEKKLAGAAKNSFIKKCVADAQKS